MKHIKNAVIVSGGNIDVDFALDFLKKIKRKEPFMIAADRGLEFFEKTGLVPDAAVGDFDSLSIEGQKFLDTLKNTEILRLKPEKDDSDTQSAACFAMDRGAESIFILGATGKRIDHLLANFGLLVLGAEKGAEIILVVELYETDQKRNNSEKIRAVWQICIVLFSGWRCAWTDTERIQVSSQSPLSDCIGQWSYGQQ